MAFDGITIHALVNEFNDKLLNGRINKIAQPEKDELLLTVKSANRQFRLLLSANASLPLAYLTNNNKPSPLSAPNFCMLLRKHLNNGRITAISQPGLERIIDITIEHLDEMGDLCTKHLMIELMGKHSNIIFTDDNDRIIDSIKRINASVSSIREVLPGLTYFIPKTDNKLDAFSSSREEFISNVCALNLPLSKAIYSTYTGFSPLIAEELCHEAGIDSRIPACELDELSRMHISGIFCNFADDVKKELFKCCIVYNNNSPKDFFVTEPSSYSKDDCRFFDSVSTMLEYFYHEKNNITRIHQRSADLRQIITTILERDYKKYDLQEKQLKDTEKREKYKLYGELLNAYGYQIEQGMECTVTNYYDNTEITIPLDENLTPLENSRRYFEKYSKQKRTFEALNELILTTKAEIDQLESIKTSLEIATSYDDLIQIKEELVTYGFIRNKNTGKKNRAEKSKSRPLHYISTDGFDIYVGKTNIQNEEVTFKLATGNDWWFHAKDMPGSHVVVKSQGKELPDSTFEDAARLAAYYSKGRDMEKVEIDYIEKKHVKKVPGAALGFVIYHTNYSMNISPDISGIQLLED